MSDIRPLANLRVEVCRALIMGTKYVSQIVASVSWYLHLCHMRPCLESNKRSSMCERSKQHQYKILMNCNLSKSVFALLMVIVTALQDRTRFFPERKEWRDSIHLNYHYRYADNI